jgi:hypothetical protein
MSGRTLPDLVAISVKSLEYNCLRIETHPE